MMKEKAVSPPTHIQDGADVVDSEIDAHSPPATDNQTGTESSEMASAKSSSKNEKAILESFVPHPDSVSSRIHGF